MQSPTISLPKELELTGRQILHAANEVYNELGPGLVEEIYRACLCYELETMELQVQHQVEIPFEYKEFIFDEGMTIDLLVANEVICTIKANDRKRPVWEAELLSQLKLTGLRLAYVINFHTHDLREGVNRIVF